MKLYRLNRTVLSVKNNTEKFLNGLTSNTIHQPQNAFLDIHGKIIATFDQIRIADDEFLLAIEAPFVEGVLQHIDRFVKLSKVDLHQTDLKVYFDLEGTYRWGTEEWNIPQNVGQLIIAPKDLETTVTPEAFTLFRLQNNIPLQGVDYNHEMLLNVDDKNYVSFTKGCFLGQELVAKVHNRSQPTWKLVVQYADEAKAERQPMTSKIVDPKTGRSFGFVFVKNH